MTSLMYKSIVSTEKEHKEYTGLTPSSRGTQLTQPSAPHHPLKLHLEPEIQQQHLLFCLLVHYEAGPNTLQGDHELPAVPHGEDPHIASRQKYTPNHQI